MAGDWFIAYGTNHHWPCISFLGCYLVNALEGELEIVALLAVEDRRVCRHTSRAKPSPTAAAENSIAVNESTIPLRLVWVTGTRSDFGGDTAAASSFTLPSSSTIVTSEVSAP